MSRHRYGPLVAVLLAGALTLSACGGAGRDQSVASVGGRRVTLAAVEHWIKVLAPQHAIPHRGASYHALERKALEFLISSDWLQGEAAREGIPVGESEVRLRLHGKEATYQGGHQEYAEVLKAVGQTPADVKLEIADQLASTKLTQRLQESEPQVTDGAIEAYYNRNIKQFEHPEARTYHIFENLPSVQTARTMIREIKQGKKSIGDGSLYQTWDRPSDLHTARTILKTIFTLPLHTLSGPVNVNGYYFLVKLIKITPSYRETLAQAWTAIRTMLASEQHRRALARFIAAWQRRWTAKTSCSPGYVVQKCQQFKGTTAAEEPLGPA